METGIQSSFIPQDASQPSAGPRFTPERGGLSDLIVLIAIVAFVASLALGGAVFLYGQYLSSSAASKLEQLKRAREAFEPATVQEITRLDDRMRVAEDVLGLHLPPTAFFYALQQASLSTVSFSSLEMSAVDPQRITVKMSGVAESVNSIALQADLFSKNGVIVSPIFSDITREPDGVHFNLTAFVNPAAINYVRLIAGLVQQSQPQTPAVPQQPNSSEQTPFGPPASGASESGTTTQ